MSLPIAALLGIGLFHLSKRLWQRMELSHQLILLVLVIAMLYSLIQSMIGRQLPALDERVGLGVAGGLVLVYIFSLMRQPQK